MLNNLREATQKLHNEIEQDNLAGLIMDHTITLEQYKLLLLQNYTAYKVIESKIAFHLKDYQSTKSDLLEKDLISLNVSTTQINSFNEDITISNQHEALGAAYVVEGSVLGGMMISKAIPNCENLYSIEKHHFFNGKRDSVEGWKSFSKYVNSKHFSEKEQEIAARKAQETFQFFGKVFNEVKLE